MFKVYLFGVNPIGPAVVDAADVDVVFLNTYREEESYLSLSSAGLVAVVKVDHADVVLVVALAKVPS